MRQAVVETSGDAQTICLRECPTPDPGEGQVQVRVAYAALNPLDCHARAERIRWRHPGFPFVPGFEFAGRVSAIGRGVDEDLLGRRVACNGQWGGNADYAVVDANSIERVPDDFDWKLAASYSTCAYTAWLLIHSAGRVKPGEVVAVHSAAGAVGALTLQVARSAGATVIGLAGGDRKLDTLSRFGAHHRVDYLRDDWPQTVLEASGGRGADLIIDGNGGANALRNLECIAPLGRIVFLGATAGPAGQVDISQLIAKSCAIEGFVQYAHQAVSGGAEKREMQKRLGSGEWVIPIGEIFELEALADAHQAWESRALSGRALIRIGGDAV
jgi:NADPH2:quinone reductase